MAQGQSVICALCALRTGMQSTLRVLMLSSCCRWQGRTIQKGRDVVAVRSVLGACFHNGAVNNGMIDGFVLMDQPIAQPGASGNIEGEGSGQHSCLRRFEKRIVVILGRRA